MLVIHLKISILTLFKNNNNKQIIKYKQILTYMDFFAINFWKIIVFIL